MDKLQKLNDFVSDEQVKDFDTYMEHSFNDLLDQYSIYKYNSNFELLIAMYSERLAIFLILKESYRADVTSKINKFNEWKKETIDKLEVKKPNIHSRTIEIYERMTDRKKSLRDQIQTNSEKKLTGNTTDDKLIHNEEFQLKEKMKTVKQELSIQNTPYETSKRIISDRQIELNTELQQKINKRFNQLQQTKELQKYILIENCINFILQILIKHKKSLGVESEEHGVKSEEHGVKNELLYHCLNYYISQRKSTRRSKKRPSQKKSVSKRPTPPRDPPREAWGTSSRGKKSDDIIMSGIHADECQGSCEDIIFPFLNYSEIDHNNEDKYYQHRMEGDIISGQGMYRNIYDKLNILEKIRNNVKPASLTLAARAALDYAKGSLVMFQKALKEALEECHETGTGPIGFYPEAYHGGGKRRKQTKKHTRNLRKTAKKYRHKMTQDKKPVKRHRGRNTRRH